MSLSQPWINPKRWSYKPQLSDLGNESISHLGKRKIIHSKLTFSEWYVGSKEGNSFKKTTNQPGIHHFCVADANLGPRSPGVFLIEMKGNFRALKPAMATRNPNYLAVTFWLHNSFLGYACGRAKVPKEFGQSQKGKASGIDTGGSMKTALLICKKSPRPFHISPSLSQPLISKLPLGWSFMCFLPFLL